MKSDMELDTWRAQWQSETAVPAGLRRRVERDTRHMRFMLASEILVTVGIGGGATAWAIGRSETHWAVLALAVWLFIGAAWTFGLRSRRGNWSPSALDGAAYLDLSIRRCRSRLAATAFGIGLYFAEMAFCISWIWYDAGRFTPLPLIIFAVATPLFLWAVIRHRRRTRAELASLLALAQDENLLTAPVVLPVAVATSRKD